MTRKQFEAKAIKAAERDLGIPTGWWGIYRDVTDGNVRVKFVGSYWRVSSAGIVVSDHDSRDGAIRKARSL